jgi:hypothetical protein
MLKPHAAIRRFDVFAEYSRQEALHKGLAADEAKGYGIWLAKVVAARRFGPPKAKKEPAGEKPELVGGKWRTLSDEPQTDELFDHEIVERMGRGFYRQVFAPAIRRAIHDGKKYVEIRDSIRKSWKPAK